MNATIEVKQDSTAKPKTPSDDFVRVPLRHLGTDTVALFWPVDVKEILALEGCEYEFVNAADHARVFPNKKESDNADTG